MKTKYGNFGNFKDLYLFMNDENLTEIEVEASYCLSKIMRITLTLDDVKNAMNFNINDFKEIIEHPTFNK